MLLTKKPLLRVIPGPNPNEFGVIGKPHTKPVENIMEKNRRLEDARGVLVKQDKELHSELLKISFLDDSTRKAKLRHVKRNVDEIMNQRGFLLNERRNKLKLLLLNEEEMLEKELENLVESPLERASKLREKARQIREERDKERSDFVNEKLDQKWRSECDELRNLQSKHLQAEMRLEHLRQMEEKVCKERHKVEEEAMYADLWRNDMLAKKEREDNEARDRAERNLHTAKILKEQMLVLEKQKEEEKRLRAENARLAQERLNIEKMEKQLAHQEKVKQQAARKNELDQSVRLKMSIEAKKAQEEMALDLMLLEEALATTKNEEEDKLKRKQELMEEGRRYREYLKAQLEEEKRKEKELEKLVDAEIERQFQKRLNQWRAEKEARKRLLTEVLRERRIQVEDKIRRNEEQQKQLELEKIELNQRIEYYKQLEKEEQKQLMAKHKNYQNDLLGQIDFYKQMKDREKMLVAEEYQAGVDAENDYQRRLVYNIQNMKFDNLHPIRNWQQPNYEPNNGFCEKCKKQLFTPSRSSIPPPRIEDRCTCPIVYYN